MNKSFKELLNDVKCGKVASPVFTEADLANVKACLPEPIAPFSFDAKIEVPETDSCVNEGIEEIKKIVKAQLKKQGTVIEAGTVKGKLEEVLDHYKLISNYYKARVDFFNATITKIEPLTSEYLYWTDETIRLSGLERSIYNSFFKSKTSADDQLTAFTTVVEISDRSFNTIPAANSSVLSNIIGNYYFKLLRDLSYFQNYFNTRKARIAASTSQAQAKNGATNALTQNIKDLPELPSAPQTEALLKELTAKSSGQLVPIFLPTEKAFPNGGIVIPARTVGFGIRLINLDSTEITYQDIKDDDSTEEIKRLINIRQNTNLSSSPFSTTLGSYCFSVIPGTGLLTETNYETVPGALYNFGDNGYVGLYRKLSNPIQYLYTPEERGLTINPDNIDPVLKDVKDAPVSIVDNGVTFYIANQQTYTKFFKIAQASLPGKIKKEKEEIFPKQIQSSLLTLANFAQREVADFFRNTKDLAIKLSRPTTYVSPSSGIYSQGKFTYSKLDKLVSGRLAYYTKVYDEILAKITECTIEIEKLNAIIEENSMSPSVLEAKILSIACFASSLPPKKDCETETMDKLGQDPLYIRTLDGTDSKLPDMNNPCYWREFTNALNEISLLPIPDITAPVFRYYPITNIIPTPFGIVMIPFPQKWKTLFTLSTPLGTVVAFLTLPALIVGIPLPSVYVMYFAPDGKKYMLFAPNIPLLLKPGASSIGFEVDSGPKSQNPFGLDPANPFKGQLIKGSLTVPLTISAKSAKATRLAKIAAALALGQPIDITTKNGTPIGVVDPITYTTQYLSALEFAENGSDFDPAKDFERQIKEFRRNINRQFDRLGEMQLSAVTKLKDKTRKSRDESVKSAEDEPDLKKRRELKNSARDLDPVKLTDKIHSVLEDFEKYIDKIKLGTISFPDDPTKLNPKLPGAITGLQPLIEMASKGGLDSDPKSKNLIAKIRRMAAQVDVSKLKIKKTFNLNKTEDVKSFKKAIKEYSNEALAYLSGDKSPVDDIDPNLSDAEKAEIKKSSELRKARLKNALAFTSLSIVAPKLKLFDPAAPCCSTDDSQDDTNIASPQILAAIAIFNAILDAVLDGLTIDNLKSLLGDSLENIGLSTISSLFDSILATLPPIPLPDKANMLALTQIMLLPTLIATHIPQAPNPLGIPFPVQLSIPLDALVKPLLKAAVAYLLELILKMLADAGNMLSSSAGSNTFTDLKEIIRQIPCGNSEFAIVATSSTDKYVTVTLPNGISIKLPKIPMIPLDLVAYFSLLTSTDLVELIRGLILSAIDGILKPLQDVVTPILSLTKTLKDLSFNIIEAGNPFILIIKLLKMALQLQIPNSYNIKISNLEAMNLIRLAYIPVITATEPVVKEVAYLGAIVACALGSKPGVQIARVASNPFFNQDDLPPWERLTRKNPLFAIFLDEIAWRSSTLSTGSLLFRTKLPGLYPTGWTPNVNIDPGVH